MSVKEFWGTIGRKLSAFKKACVRTCMPDEGYDENRSTSTLEDPPSRYESETVPAAMAEAPKSGGMAEEFRTESAHETTESTDQIQDEQSESSDRQSPHDDRERSEFENRDDGPRELSVHNHGRELSERPVIDPDDLRELMDALRALPESMTSLSTALREQLALPGQIAQVLEKYRESGVEEELLESIRDLATESKNQTDCLQAIQNSMHTAEQTQQKVIQSLAQLNEATETNNKATASQAELMEQVRDHLSNANSELRDQVEAHTNQLKKLGMVVMAILVAGMAAMIVAILMK